MAFVLKFIMLLLVLAGIGLVGYAYLGDLTPDRHDVVEPVTLDAK